MKSYSLREASEIMISNDTVENYKLFYGSTKSKYDILINDLVDYGFIYYDKHWLSQSNKKVYILTDDFKDCCPKEASLYFEEKWVYNKYYQLRINEEGIKNLFNFIVKLLGEELFR